MTTHHQKTQKIVQSESSETALAGDIVKLMEMREVSYQATHALARGRANAVARVRNTQQTNGNTLSLVGQFSGYLNQHRAITAMSFIGIVFCTFLLLQELNHQALQNSDAFLLASDLPPEAFADKGFDSWIEAKSQY